MKNDNPQISSVLIVDDNPKNLQVLGNCLQDEGFEIEFSLNGRSALDWIDRKDFDLVLLDIMMPGMDGYEVFKILKSTKGKQEIPVIFLTAIVDAESIVKAFDLGAVDYISKPFNQKELLSRVRTQIEIKKNRDEIKRQLKEIEFKNKLITYSIKYAKSIQTAVLKSSQKLLECFPNSFSLEIPKDIVSGDFYWAKKVDDKFLLGVFDCTGHGVPGAFMSLLFATFLNEAVNTEKIQEPHLILNRLREKVIEAMDQKAISIEVNNGMDAVIILYDPKNKTLHFSGALNKMYLIRNNEILEYRGDRMSVSYFDRMKEFTMQEIKVKKDDVIYLTTDGYFDQFGGPIQKKMGSANFKEIIKVHYKEPMEIQKEIFFNAYLNWKGEDDQVDDVSIVGIRF